MPVSASLFQPCDRILVVGGNSRKVGKTALLIDILRAFPAPGQVAVKISSHSPGDCPVNGPSCSCGPDEHTFSFREDGGPTPQGDTSRFLAAGAERAVLLGAKEGRLTDGLPLLSRILAGADRVVFESNTIARFLRHACYLAVMDPQKLDFKSSLARTLSLVDVFVLRSPLTACHWPTAYLDAVRQRARFLYPKASPFPAVLAQAIRKRFVAA